MTLSSSPNTVTPGDLYLHQLSVFRSLQRIEADSGIWVEDRSFFPDEGKHHKSYYLKELPVFDPNLNPEYGMYEQSHGITAQQVIETFIDRGETPEILDVGFGNGEALLSLFRRYGTNVRLFGYGAKAILKRYPNREELLKDSGITLVEGNIIEMPRRLKAQGVEPHVIVSCYLVPHIKRYPHMELFKKFYYSLKVGGFGFIQGLHPFLYPETHKKALEFLSAYGCLLGDIDGASFYKLSAQRLPVSSDITQINSFGTYDIRFYEPS